MKDYILKRPMLLSALICSTVSVLGYYYKISILFLGAFLVAVLIWLILRRKSTQSMLIVLTVIFLTLSLFLTHGRADTLNKHIGKTAECSFIVTDVTYSSADYCRANIEVTDSVILPRGAKLSVSYSGDFLDMGDRVTGKIKLKEIDDDLKTFNYSEGIFINGSLKDYKILKNSSDFVLKAIGKIRVYVSSTLFNNLGYSNASTVGGILLGENRYFTDDFHSNIKASGVSHVMVVSGMHLSVFVLIATFLIEKLIYNKYLRALLIVFTVLFLTAVCGFTTSMLRAGITYLLMAVALLFDRKPVPENTLGTAVSLILIFSPFTILSIGFQLSVLATFGILAVSLPIIKFLKRRELIRNKIILSLFSVIITILSAALLTLPVSIIAFGYISNVSLFTNFLISLAVSIILWLAVFGLVINLIFPSIAKCLFNICEPIVSYVNSVINEFGSIEVAVLGLKKSAAVVTVLIIILIFVILLACKKRVDMLKLKEMRKKLIAEGGTHKDGGGF